MSEQQCSSRVFVYFEFQHQEIKPTTNVSPLLRGPSIYDVHTEGEGAQARLDACGLGGPAPCGRPHRKLKLESTDIILSSPHAKKLASFLPKVSSLDRKKWKFFCDINY